MDISDVFMANVRMHYGSPNDVTLRGRWKTVFRDILQVFSEASSIRHRIKGEEKTLIWRMTYPYFQNMSLFLDMVSNAKFEELEKTKNEEIYG